MGSGSVPKVLVMLNNKPLILHLLEEVDKIHQLAKPVIVVGFMADQVKAVLGDGYLYATQKEQLGTAHAVKCAKSKVTGKDILVLYGDMPFIKAESLKKLMRLHHEKKSKLSLFTATVPNFTGNFSSLNHFGRILRGPQSQILKITEYKDAAEEEKQIKEVNPGIYMFNSEWLWNNINKIKSRNAQGEYYLTDAVEIAIGQGEKIYSLPIGPCEVLGINTREELLQAEQAIAKA